MLVANASLYSYESTVVQDNVVKPVTTKMKIRTETKVPKVRTRVRTKRNPAFIHVAHNFVGTCYHNSWVSCWSD